jgi:hypothetical protein
MKCKKCGYEIEFTKRDSAIFISNVISVIIAKEILDEIKKGD